MTGILYRYRILLIIISLIVFGLLAFWILSRQSLEKIPSRGVFVCDFEQLKLKQT